MYRVLACVCFVLCVADAQLDVTSSKKDADQLAMDACDLFSVSESEIVESEQRLQDRLATRTVALSTSTTIPGTIQMSVPPEWDRPVTTLTRQSTHSLSIDGQMHSLSINPNNVTITERYAFVVADRTQPIGRLPNPYQYMRTSSVAVDSTAVIAARSYAGYQDRVNGRGGYDLGTSGNYFVLVDWEVFNAGGNATTRAANEAQIFSDIASGVYGAIATVFPDYQSGYIPAVKACELYGSCIVYNSLIATRSLYECTPPLPSDCTSHNRTAGAQRSPYQIGTLQNQKYIFQDVAGYLHEKGAKTMAILGTTSGNVSFAQYVWDQGLSYDLVSTLAPLTWGTTATGTDDVIDVLMQQIRDNSPDLLVVLAVGTDSPTLIQIADWMIKNNWTPDAIVSIGGALAIVEKDTVRFKYWIGVVPWIPDFNGQAYNSASVPGSFAPFATPLDFYTQQITTYPEILPSFTPLSAICVLGPLIAKRIHERTGMLYPTIPQRLAAFKTIYGEPSVLGLTTFDAWGVKTPSERSAYQVGDQATVATAQHVIISPVTNAQPTLYPMPSYSQRAETIAYTLSLMAYVLPILFLLCATVVSMALTEQAYRKGEWTTQGWSMSAGAILSVGIWAATATAWISIQPSNIYDAYKQMLYGVAEFFAPLVVAFCYMPFVFYKLVTYSIAQQIAAHTKYLLLRNAVGGAGGSDAGAEDDGIGVTDIPSIHLNSTQIGRPSKNVTVTIASPIALAGYNEKQQPVVGGMSAPPAASAVQMRSRFCCGIHWPPVGLLLVQLASGIGFTIPAIFIGISMYIGVFLSAQKSLDTGLFAAGVVICVLCQSCTSWMFFNKVGKHRKWAAPLMTLGYCAFIWCSVNAVRLSRLVPDVVVSNGLDDTTVRNIAIGLCPGLCGLALAFSVDQLKLTRNGLNQTVREMREEHAKDKRVAQMHEHLIRQISSSHNYYMHVFELVMQLIVPFGDDDEVAENDPRLAPFHQLLEEIKKAPTLFMNAPGAGAGAGGATFPTDEKRQTDASILPGRTKEETVVHSRRSNTHGDVKTTEMSEFNQIITQNVDGAKNTNMSMKTLDRIMSHPLSLSLWIRYQTKARTAENISFLMCLEACRVLAPIARRARLTQIYNTFIVLGSPRQVNIGVDHRAAVAKCLGAECETHRNAKTGKEMKIYVVREKATVEDFAIAANEVRRLMALGELAALTENPLYPIVMSLIDRDQTPYVVNGANLLADTNNELVKLDLPPIYAPTICTRRLLARSVVAE